MATKLFRNLVIGGVLAAGLGAMAVKPRSFSDKRRNYVPTLSETMYAHRGLHDAGSGLDDADAPASNEYVQYARSMAVQAGYGSMEDVDPIAPENSLPAFAAAAEAGFGIELDVQSTADGQIVVIHDADLMRVAGDSRKIADLTYDELVRIPLFPGAEPGAAVSPLATGEMPAGQYQHVPLLSDVLRLVDGRVPIIVEFKFDDMRSWGEADENFMNAAADLLDAYQGEYAVESFNPAAMNWYKQNHPDVCRGQLAQDLRFGEGDPVVWGAGKLVFNWMSRPDFVAYDVQNASSKALKLVRSMGALAVGWTVRSAEQYDEAMPYFDRFIFESFVPEGTPGHDLAL
ncbi:glycerophosphodiester phosphodiesterase family protein [Bifidobacterium cuniculi]|uniref:Phosphodiesterase n=1 Tax=Bifidobacterium cuniculi TaxID=1688 RepID=A0A087B2P4_9BIFI|nr:glycerophosphodiester phosphodiesterase family protein [Bifidobacterium cuniculi]KFI65294.1 phosphodiesterase [Bifidobacterium cuniculi]